MDVKVRRSKSASEEQVLVRHRVVTSVSSANGRFAGDVPAGAHVEGCAALLEVDLAFDNDRLRAALALPELLSGLRIQGLEVAVLVRDQDATSLRVEQ